MKLEIIDLRVEVAGKEIIKGVTATFEKGKTVALMGPNGSGKSTLALALAGHPKYKITKGKILLDGKDITKETPDSRAKNGLFLSFQHPQEITGVNLSTFLRSSLQNVKGKKIDVMDFHKLLKEKMAELGIEEQFKQRYLNVGFSGGEKKRMEILQLSLLEPKYAILDETDSGLDVDSLRLVCDAVNKVKKKDMGIVLITHYNRILKFIQPDQVHVLYKGKIVKSGGKELAHEIEENGFKGYLGDE
ncbi:TPA: Fe-S cluster assembly ATPase SufC [Candidatus Woesearchaeota archaeon]|nr:Fe-S cluster assembly ATPase SufC [Candidatus Woesearchaeota archaeon]HIH39161.1 Fe-S cluster assembly ATPase SufC [Candidatus Woesearchaeota archaeon]